MTVPSANVNVNACGFQAKKIAKLNEIKGTKASLTNKQLLVSTGVPTFDAVLGGGLAVGTVLLIEEDDGAVYSSLLTKYFLAEGVASNHELFVANLDHDPQYFINALPGIFDTTAIRNDKLPTQKKESDDELKIAWRYKNMRSQVCVSDQFGHYFDISKKMDVELLEKCKINYFKNMEISENPESVSSHMWNLANEVKSLIESANYSTSSQTKHENILRICISSLASPLWNNVGEDEKDFASSVCRFLLSLRHLMRTSYAVCLITLPPGLFQGSTYLLKRFEYLCDTVVGLESFAGSPIENEESFKDYNGLFRVIKLPRLNSLLPNNAGDTSDLVFKVKKKRFTIEVRLLLLCNSLLSFVNL
ncbi:hypothetical protein HELRODRAFT_89732 [Helobdella robusta]|uniref:Elongator complex protein 4 n=1 Tax=Helobdella robusta TaxID=6412 RepID=T1G7G7_HELRO|nr:hypothetical protein HELRODRAFT_89732 [Helobdella robusta]ESN92260.1 hypothetical protein HELRODRAFT_89732 [Helobdella robusta]